MVAAALSVPTETYQGDPVHFQANTDTTPGNLQTLISQVTPADISRDIYKVLVVCRFEGKVQVFVDSILIGSGVTGPANSNLPITWFPPQNAKANQTILITYLPRTGSPVVPVECYLMCADVVS